MIVEPNLKRSAGHFYQAIKALYAYLKNRKIVEQFYVISHKDTERTVLKEFPNIYPVAEKTCFETEDYQITLAYLRSIIHQFEFAKPDDLILIPTAHLNEIKAVSSLSKEKNCPKFFLQIHQFHPPA